MLSENLLQIDVGEEDVVIEVNIIAKSLFLKEKVENCKQFGEIEVVELNNYFPSSKNRFSIQ